MIEFRKERKRRFGLGLEHLERRELFSIAPVAAQGAWSAGDDDTFQLTIVEERAAGAILLAPSTGEVVSPWIPDVDLDDITLLPEDSPFEGRVAFDQIVEEDGSQAQTTNSLLSVPLPGLYDEGPINPPGYEVETRSGGRDGAHVEFEQGDRTSTQPACDLDQDMAQFPPISIGFGVTRELRCANISENVSSLPLDRLPFDYDYFRIAVSNAFMDGAVLVASAADGPMPQAASSFEILMPQDESGEGCCCHPVGAHELFLWIYPLAPWHYGPPGSWIGGQPTPVPGVSDPMISGPGPVSGGSASPTSRPQVGGSLAEGLKASGDKWAHEQLARTFASMLAAAGGLTNQEHEEILKDGISPEEYCYILGRMYFYQTHMLELAEPRICCPLHGEPDMLLEGEGHSDCTRAPK